MVFFVCGACGDSFKRKQADQHTFRCKNWNFSCMDCNKDFFGQSYVQHTQCISESEKYFGSHHVAKTTKDKNEIWMEKVRKHLANQKNLKPFIARLVSRVLNYPNIPRKKPKFENFLATSMNLRNQAIVDELWNLVASASEVDAKETSDKENDLRLKNGDNEAAEDTTLEQEKEEGKDKKKRKRELVEHERENGIIPQKGIKSSKKSKKQKSLLEDEQKTIEGDEKEDEVPVESKSEKRRKRKQRRLESATEEPDPLAPARVALQIDPSVCYIGDSQQLSVEAVQASKDFKWRSTLKRLLRDGPQDGVKINKLLNIVETLHNDSLSGAAQPLPRDTLQSILMKTLSRKPFTISSNKARIGKSKTREN